MRKLLHTREIICKGYERDDGLWDIEGHLSDVKTYDVINTDGVVKLKSGEPLHSMWLRIAVDTSLTIVEAEARTESAPYSECPMINAVYSTLIGMTIGAGFSALVRKRFKGAEGCTHLTELIGPLATTAFQTLWPVLEKNFVVNDELISGAKEQKRPSRMDSCYALRSSGEEARIRWPGYIRQTV